jgi:hypothetical protein
MSRHNHEVTHQMLCPPHENTKDSLGAKKPKIKLLGKVFSDHFNGTSFLINPKR